MSYTEALSRVAVIQSQMAALSRAPAQGASASAGAAGAQSFNAALASAQASAGAAASAGSGAYGTAYGSGSYGSSPYATGSGALATSALSAPGGLIGVQAGSAEALPAGARSLLTPNQQSFAARLSALTGLNPGVVSAWLLAEESGEAAKSRESAGNNDWLNIGYTDSGTYGSTDALWSNPIGAAEATAGWLKGQNSIPGYGSASPGVQAILGSAAGSPEAQIAAIQGSGWASSGYPDLPSLYRQVAA